MKPYENEVHLIVLNVHLVSFPVLTDKSTLFIYYLFRCICLFKKYLFIHLFIYLIFHLLLYVCLPVVVLYV